MQRTMQRTIWHAPAGVHCARSALARARGRDAMPRGARGRRRGGGRAARPACGCRLARDARAAPPGRGLWRAGRRAAPQEGGPHLPQYANQRAARRR
eukprot:scaffold71210_cov78-Phaeocystis_antarctica.AAC.7